MTILESLLEQVKQATGREIALEREIMCTVGGWQRLSPSQHPRNHKHPMFVDTQEGYGTFEGRTLYRDVPRIMESVDAAVALVERKFPNSMKRVFDNPDDGSSRAELVTETGLISGGDAETWPLAILAAALSALIAQG